MTSSDYRWPHTGRDCPQDIAKHASCLKTDFDLVSKTVDISLTLSTRLPSTLKSSILTGIEKGLAEVRKIGYCPKWSKVNESTFRDVVLENIATEAALQARDRIPLKQFNGLHKSYNALHTKLVAQLPPTATTHKPAGANASIPATSVGRLFDPSKAINTAMESVRASGKTVTSPQEKKGKDVTEKKSDGNPSEEGNRGEAKSEDKESEKEERKEEERWSQVADDGQAVTDSEDSESASDSSEDSSNDSSSGGEEETEVQNYTASQEAKNLKIIKNGIDFSATFNINIKHQANVNLLAGISSQLLLRVDVSLKAFTHKQPSVLNLSGVSGAELRENGDVKIVVDSPTCGALQMFMDLAGWDDEFERTLVASPVPKYWLTMQNVQVSSFRFQNRKEKAAMIKGLADENLATGERNSVVDPIIGDIA